MNDTNEQLGACSVASTSSNEKNDCEQNVTKEELTSSSNDSSTMSIEIDEQSDSILIAYDRLCGNDEDSEVNHVNDSYNAVEIDESEAEDAGNVTFREKEEKAFSENHADSNQSEYLKKSENFKESDEIVYTNKMDKIKRPSMATGKNAYERYSKHLGLSCNLNTKRTSSGEDKTPFSGLIHMKNADAGKYYSFNWTGLNRKPKNDMEGENIEDSEVNHVNDFHDTIEIDEAEDAGNVTFRDKEKEFSIGRENIEKHADSNQSEYLRKTENFIESDEKVYTNKIDKVKKPSMAIEKNAYEHYSKHYGLSCNLSTKRTSGENKTSFPGLSYMKNTDAGNDYNFSRIRLTRKNDMEREKIENANTAKSSASKSFGDIKHDPRDIAKNDLNNILNLECGNIVSNESYVDDTLIRFKKFKRDTIKTMPFGVQSVDDTSIYDKNMSNSLDSFSDEMSKFENESPVSDEEKEVTSITNITMSASSSGMRQWSSIVSGRDPELFSTNSDTSSDTDLKNVCSDANNINRKPHFLDTWGKVLLKTPSELCDDAYDSDTTFDFQSIKETSTSVSKDYQSYGLEHAESSESCNNNEEKKKTAIKKLNFDCNYCNGFSSHHVDSLLEHFIHCPERQIILLGLKSKAP